MQRERAALALFLLRTKQARPAREPDAIFDKSAISIQHSEPLVAFRPSLRVAAAVDVPLQGMCLPGSSVSKLFII
jgi:hypothetical protein